VVVLLSKAGDGNVTDKEFGDDDIRQLTLKLKEFGIF
jgi:hypothetical protein